MAQDSVMLWNGVQSSQFFSGISNACDTALNTTLSCPNTIQLLASGIQAVRTYCQILHLPVEYQAEITTEWNTSMMTELCTPTCEASLGGLLTNVQAGCGDEAYPFNGGTMTWVEQVQYFQYKYGLVCLQDQFSSDFCEDVEAG